MNKRESAKRKRATKNAAKVRAHKAGRPVYFVVRRVAILDTGEECGALVPLTKWDVEIMRERKMHTGKELRASLTEKRNVKFHRLAHAIGALMCEQVEGFESLGAHGALKRLQLEADVCCELVQMDASPITAAVMAAADAVLGVIATKLLAAVLPSIETISVKRAQSMAFDSMDEGVFQDVVAKIFRHMGATYFDGMTEEAVEQMVEIYELQH